MFLFIVSIQGLLDAISVVSSKAEVRFCARHIWANFKNKFSGTAYKDLFWAAARSTTKVCYSSTWLHLGFHVRNRLVFLDLVAFRLSC